MGLRNRLEIKRYYSRAFREDDMMILLLAISFTFYLPYVEIGTSLKKLRLAYYYDIKDIRKLSSCFGSEVDNLEGIGTCGTIGGDDLVIYSWHKLEFSSKDFDSGVLEGFGYRRSSRERKDFNELLSVGLVEHLRSCGIERGVDII